MIILMKILLFGHLCDDNTDDNIMVTMLTMLAMQLNSLIMRKTRRWFARRALDMAMMMMNDMRMTMMIRMPMMRMRRRVPVCQFLEHLSCNQVTGQLQVSEVRGKAVLDQLLQLVWEKMTNMTMNKGSHHERKVQFFWTLFKRPPPPFRLNIMWWIFLKEF